jgi:hypothetical protein
MSFYWTAKQVLDFTRPMLFKMKGDLVFVKEGTNFILTIRAPALKSDISIFEDQTSSEKARPNEWVVLPRPVYEEMVTRLKGFEGGLKGDE